jgi:RNA polymerase-binding transcription factor DksA
VYSPFSPEFIERQRVALVNRMIDLRTLMSEKPEPVDVEDPGDLGDKASIVTETHCKSALMAKAFAELADIDAALTRIQRGSYGICELTNQPISTERLEAFPAARFSVQAQSRVERKLRRVS